MDRVNVGLLGLGTVGSGVAELLLRRRVFLARQAGIPIVLKKIVTRHPRRVRSVRVPDGMVSGRPADILEDPQIHVVVELIGGVTTARKVVLAAIRAGKSVVTANKALLAHHGAELFLAARKKGVDLYFEASVAGGIPVIKGLREGLIGNEVEGIYGILNGTSNYILSEMGKGEGRSFEAALAEAQQRGYAERNPRLDLNGMDTAHKLSVLTLLAFGRAILPEKMHVEGVNGITADDIRNAAGFGSVIKLLGIAKRSGRSLEARVHPVLLPKNHPLASVHGVHNAVSVKGDWVGELMLTGQGAGRRPTTSAVVADIVDVARNLAFGTPQRVPLPGPNKDIRQVRRIGQLEGRYYFRFACIDRPGVLSRISRILGSHRISIASMVQKDRRRDQVVPLIMTTHEARERDVHEALKMIDKLAVVRGKPVRIRMERA